MTPPNGLVDLVIDETYLAASAAMMRYVGAQAARILDRCGAPTAGGAVVENALAWLRARATDDDLSAVARDLGEHAATVGLSRPFIDYVAEHYPAFLRGERSAQAILFKGPGPTLWDGYFSAANPLYDVHNQLAAAGLRAAWDELRRPPQILELGTGTGGATAPILAAMDALPGGAGAILTISDVAPSLLIRASERLALDAARVRRQRLDFERAFDEQGLAPGSIDAVVATNALHNARDLGETLEHCRRALAADGALVISESICGRGAAVHQDFIFNLLPRSRPSAPGGEGGSRFLPGERWRTALAASGLAGNIFVNRRGPELALLAVMRPA